MHQLIVTTILLLLINLPSNIIETLKKNATYDQKGIDIWAQVSERQIYCTKKAFLAKLCLLFGLLQGSTKETPSYMGKY